jgi:hypothetical protein
MFCNRLCLCRRHGGAAPPDEDSPHRACTACPAARPMSQASIIRWYPIQDWLRRLLRNDDLKFLVTTVRARRAPHGQLRDAIDGLAFRELIGTEPPRFNTPSGFPDEE